MKLCKFIYWLAHRLCPEMVWNRDMSLEIDRLLQRIQELEERE